jgi:hypothetical protein
MGKSVTPVTLTYEKDSQTFGIIGSVLLSLLPVLLIGASSSTRCSRPAGASA